MCLAVQNKFQLENTTCANKAKGTVSKILTLEGHATKGAQTAIDVCKMFERKDTFTYPIIAAGKGRKQTKTSGCRTFPRLCVRA